MSHAGDAALCIVKNGCEKAAAEYNGKMFLSAPKYALLAPARRYRFYGNSLTISLSADTHNFPISPPRIGDALLCALPLGKNCFFRENPMNVLLSLLQKEHRL